MKRIYWLFAVALVSAVLSTFLTDAMARPFPASRMDGITITIRNTYLFESHRIFVNEEPRGAIGPAGSRTLTLESGDSVRLQPSISPGSTTQVVQAGGYLIMPEGGVLSPALLVYQGE